MCASEAANRGIDVYVRNQKETADQKLMSLDRNMCYGKANDTRVDSDGQYCRPAVASPEFCSEGRGALALGARVPKFVVTKSSRSESHLHGVRYAKTNMAEVFCNSLPQ